jgi:type III pantothenate kinase
MNFVLDIGNTRSKIFLFDEGHIAARHTAEKLQLKVISGLLKKYQPEHAIVSAVVSEPQNIYRLIRKHCRLLALNYKTALPLKNRYRTKKTLGRDRLANACGAVRFFPGRNCLVIDAGTCIKYDFVSEKREYLGGAISPGMTMRFHSLHDYTARLPLVHASQTIEVIGKTTRESLLSGVQVGIANEMNGYIQLISKRYKRLKVILTGGDAVCFAHLLNFPIFAAPELTAIGLNEILEYNRSKK